MRSTMLSSAGKNLATPTNLIIHTHRADAEAVQLSYFKRFRGSVTKHDDVRNGVNMQGMIEHPVYRTNV